MALGKIGVYHIALAVAKAIEDVALVGARVRPGVSTLSSDLVLLELAVVDGAVGPLEGAATPQEAPAELTLELVAILELAGAVTVVHLAYLSAETNNLIQISSN